MELTHDPPCRMTATVGISPLWSKRPANIRAPPRRLYGPPRPRPPHCGFAEAGSQRTRVCVRHCVYDSAVTLIHININTPTVQLGRVVQT
ncbi:hypothetical protein SKAU_G00354600 [Synaphobranchus kaupii]|uniref:Uncharacterized protein n=1 Tax=Synaphobranchus kaupii TaxID=118154 RepID=A0A9Q1EH07_SYNKA|nr:hypothetical protein SKAU_G00354600 [Synaphobranchus kaupii]